MKASRFIALSLALAAASLPALADRGFAISPAAVAAAMKGAGIDASPDQIALLSDVVASTAEPVLRVQSVHPWGDHRFMVRIECATQTQCLPFMVSLHLAQDGEASLGWISRSIQATTAPHRIVAPSVLVHALSPATLLLDGDHVHIRLTVICLQNGAVGQIIRATDKTHHVVYSAEVTDNGILKGRL
jgi:hypothetical protein